MYPYLHDFFNDVFGLNLLLPFPMFGFWVAMAFLSAYYVFTAELKRKEGLGLFKPYIRTKITGGTTPSYEYLISAVIGFLLGFKILHGFFEYEKLVANPPAFLFSAEGSMAGGLLGALSALYLKHRDARRTAAEKAGTKEEVVLAHQEVGNMTVIAAIAGILGAKIFHNLEEPTVFLREPLKALLSFSGLSVFGGLIIGAAAVLYYAHKRGFGLLHVADACAPGLMLAYGVGRMGCQLSGDGDWGIPNDSAMPAWLSFLPEWTWAYDYPGNVLGINLKADFISMGFESITGKAWPTPLYESIASVLLFFVIWALRKKLSAAGQVLSFYLLLSGAERLLIERIRINPDYHFLGMAATQAEIISLLFITSGIAGFVLISRRERKKKL